MQRRRATRGFPIRRRLQIEYGTSRGHFPERLTRFGGKIYRMALTRAGVRASRDCSSTLLIYLLTDVSIIMKLVETQQDIDGRVKEQTFQPLKKITGPSLMKKRTAFASSETLNNTPIGTMAKNRVFLCRSWYGCAE